MRRHTPPKPQKVQGRQPAVAPKLSPEQLALLAQALSAQSIESIAKAYNDWNIPWTGMISEWELLSVVRQLLRLKEGEFNDDVVHTLWTSLDREGQGQIEATELLSLGTDLLESMQCSVSDVIALYSRRCVDDVVQH